MSKAVYAIVSALALTAVTFAVYWFKKGVPDTSSLLPYFYRLYEMESHCVKYDLLLQKMGVEDQKKREEMINSKDVFMIRRDCHLQLWWDLESPSAPNSWFINLAKPTDWMTPDQRVVNSVYRLKGNTLTEVQTWIRENGTKARMTITRKFEKDYLTIIRSIDNLRCESKYKYIGRYAFNDKGKGNHDAHEASKAPDSQAPSTTPAAPDVEALVKAIHQNEPLE